MRPREITGYRTETGRGEFVDRLKAKLDDWSADIDRLEAELGMLGGEMREEVRKQIAKLRGRRDEMHVKMAQIHEVSEEAWEEMSRGLEETWGALRDGVHNARGKVKRG